VNLIPDTSLERSSVVANCAMNRERGLTARTGGGAGTGAGQVGMEGRRGSISCSPARGPRVTSMAGRYTTPCSAGEESPYWGEPTKTGVRGLIDTVTRGASGASLRSSCCRQLDDIEPLTRLGSTQSATPRLLPCSILKTPRPAGTAHQPNQCGRPGLVHQLRGRNPFPPATVGCKAPQPLDQLTGVTSLLLPVADHDPGLGHGSEQVDVEAFVA
jgi:hypothetical protein